MFDNNAAITLTVPAVFAGERLSDVLRKTGHPVSSPCGGQGKCGKCRVKIISGTFLGSDGKPLCPDADGTVRACQAICPADESVIAVIEAPEGVRTEIGAAEAVGGTGIALDIGTTTLEAAKVLLESGEIVCTASCLNPQSAFGADVLSRIGAASQGHLSELQDCVLRAVRELIARLYPEGNDTSALPMTVAGNTTMLHLFSGVSPEGMGRYPFSPVFTDAKELSGEDLGLPVGNITLLPSVSAFIGSDITAGMYVCGIGTGKSPALLIDVGTNGEMVLDPGSAGNRNGLIGASTAAGPAFEGANISCGTGGVPGAVCAVSDEKGKLYYRTVDGAPAIGLCGSGLIDYTSVLYQRGIIDESGFLEADDDGAVLTAARYPDDAELPVPSVCLTQKDIREVQLAKSAIRAGVEALLDEAGMDCISFVAHGGRVFLSGGLGQRMNPMNAIKIGLLPPAFSPVLNPAGNTALAGAARALSDPCAIPAMRALAASCGVIELNSSACFNEGFIEYMAFPE